jgi:hypothetical protein
MIEAVLPLPLAPCINTLGALSTEASPFGAGLGGAWFGLDWSFGGFWGLAVARGVYGTFIEISGGCEVVNNGADYCSGFAIVVSRKRMADVVEVFTSLNGKAE